MQKKKGEKGKEEEREKENEEQNERERMEERKSAGAREVNKDKKEFKKK